METETNFPTLPLIFAFLSGIIVVSIIWVASSLFFRSSTNPPQTNPTFTLLVTTPKLNLATNQKELMVTGRVGISSIITVSLADQNVILKPTTYFASKLNLTEGKNIITITAFNPQTGESLKQTRTVFYLNEDLSSL